MPVLLPQTDQPAGECPDEGWGTVSKVLTRYVRARTSNPNMVEDVVQETVTRLIHHARTQKPVSIYALGFRIAANLLVDQHRQQKRYASEPEAEPVSQAPLPDRVIAGRQELTILSEALAAMPPLRREVIVRRRLNGQSCAAIARDLDLSLKAVEKHITRGLADLQKAIAAGRGTEGADR
jgi:RNA polymerase sigma-70 factor (ECF subfamily)